MLRFQKSRKIVCNRPKVRRRALLVSLGMLLALPLMGCGRKAPPVKPKDSKYPRDYPAQ